MWFISLLIYKLLVLSHTRKDNWTTAALPSKVLIMHWEACTSVGWNLRFVERQIPDRVFALSNASFTRHFINDGQQQQWAFFVHKSVVYKLRVNHWLHYCSLMRLYVYLPKSVKDIFSFIPLIQYYFFIRSILRIYWFTFIGRWIRPHINWHNLNLDYRISRHKGYTFVQKRWCMLSYQEWGRCKRGRRCTEHLRS